MPTILDLAGGAWPADVRRQTGAAPPGKSLVPALAKDGSVTHEYLWWYHSATGRSASAIGNWWPSGKSPWELYDLSTDRCESKNLAADHPDKVRELERAWTRHMEEFRVCVLAAPPPAPGSSGKAKTLLGPKRNVPRE